APARRMSGPIIFSSFDPGIERIAMSIISRFFSRNAPQEKQSRAGPLIAFYDQNRPRWTPRDYAGLARAGYQRNAVAYRCARLVAEAVASAPLVLFEARRELETHPFLALLAAPNARDAGVNFLEAIATHLLLAGNAYVELVSLDDAPRELHALRP